jgi:hypothetical protein
VVRAVTDPKAVALAAARCLNPRPETVDAELFAVNPFFDARDLVQVKYEMVRRVREDRVPVTVAPAQFGFSRPTFYQAAAALDAAGPAGLIPRRPGPKGGHKLTAEVMDRVAAWRDEQPGFALPTSSSASARSSGSGSTPGRWKERWPGGVTAGGKGAADGAGPAPTGLTARYEELRQAAVAGTSGSLRGAGVLTARGMPAWIRAWTRLPAAVPRPTPATAAPTVRTDELVNVLTAIALACRRADPTGRWDGR